MKQTNKISVLSKSLILLLLVISRTALFSQAITSINPNSATVGNSLTVSITGTSSFFQPSSPNVKQVYFRQNTNYIYSSSYNIITDTQLDADFTIPVASSTCYYDVYVNTYDKGNNVLLGGFLILPCASGINENSPLSSIVISSLANSGLISIENKSSVRDDIQVEVFKVTGEKIFSKKSNNTKVEINTSSFSSGTYLIRVSNEKESITKKVMILK